MPSRCLAAFCTEDAAYDVLLRGEATRLEPWWWSECVTHIAMIRDGLGDLVWAVETHDPQRRGLMAPRDVLTRAAGG